MSAFTQQQLEDIQGFGLAGFSKDRQVSIFVRVNSAVGGRALLAWLAPNISNAWEVGTFNSVFSEIRVRTAGQEPLKATWTAVMLSAAGLLALGWPSTNFLDNEFGGAFAAGMAARATEIGDTLPGDMPTGWLAPFQPGANQVHIAVVVAADDECDLDRRVVAVCEEAVKSDCDVVFLEKGATLPEPLTGHEHFGFKDGISQPAVDGYDDPPAPNEPPAVAAGEFVLGYADSTGTITGAGTPWADGSYVVFRRLTQDVAGFRAQMGVAVPNASPPLTPSEMGAKMVGRWPSGAPVELFPIADPGPGNEGDWNAFEFQGGDSTGLNCPVWAHIRKANPRDELAPGNVPAGSGSHRMIRRGIPFGPALPESASVDDGVPRGLHFFCVVSDLVRQFEFVQNNWMNNANFPIGSVPAQPGGPYTPPTAGTMAGGPDPVVSEHAATAECVLVQVTGSNPFPVATQVVHVTAGEYFFLPAIPALISLTGAVAR